MLYDKSDKISLEDARLKLEELSNKLCHLDRFCVAILRYTYQNNIKECKHGTKKNVNQQLYRSIESGLRGWL